MRFGLALSDADEICLRCPQNSDRYDYHYLTYIMIGKTELYDYIRDEVCRLLLGGGLGFKIEPLGFLPDEPDRRPADPNIPSARRQASWHFLPRIAIDFAVVSPFRIARRRRAAEDYSTTKRLNQATHARYRE